MSINTNLKLGEAYKNPQVSQMYSPEPGSQVLSTGTLNNPLQQLAEAISGNASNTVGSGDILSQLGNYSPDLGGINIGGTGGTVGTTTPTESTVAPNTTKGYVTGDSSSEATGEMQPTGELDFDALGSVFGIENLTDKIGGLFGDQNIISSEGVNLNNLFGLDKDFAGYDFLNITPSEIQKGLISSFLPPQASLAFNLLSALSKAFPSTQPNPFVNQETGEIDYSKMFDSGMLSTVYDEQGAPSYSYGTIDGIGVEAPSPDTLEEAVDQGLPFGQEGDESWTPGGGVVYHSPDYDWNADGVDSSSDSGGFDNGSDSASSIGASDYSESNYGGDGGWTSSEFSSDFGFDDW